MRKALQSVANRSVEIVSGERKAKASYGALTRSGSHTVLVRSDAVGERQGNMRHDGADGHGRA